ncbi:hypothetical protein [Confluentibacter sediminis]|uniref:hypothetical protein n=1 Tax=Confluentibacter sediminis TaxID=2219045 RepID=UPI000DAD5170|nr:hypothetical protein [Confluentibacter sediminis]
MKKSIKKNCFIITHVLLFFTVSLTTIYAQEKNNTNTDNPAIEQKSKNEKDSITLLTEKIDDLEKKIAKQNNDQSKAPLLNINDRTVKIISISFFIVMAILIILFFTNIYLQKQHFGYQSIKYIGLVIMFPGICIVAIIGQGQLISGSTLAALLGAIAGYVLSRENDPKDAKDSKQPTLNDLQKANDELQKANNELMAKEKKLTDDIVKLKAGQPI